MLKIVNADLKAKAWTFEAEAKGSKIKAWLDLRGQGQRFQGQAWTFEVKARTFKVKAWTFEAKAWTFEAKARTFKAKAKGSKAKATKFGVDAKAWPQGLVCPKHSLLCTYDYGFTETNPAHQHGIVNNCQ